MSGLTLTDAGGVEGLEVLLASGGGIEGVVTDAQGAPCPGIAVTTQWDGPPLGSAATTTGGDGSFRFEHVPPGMHHVTTELAKDKHQSATVSVAEGVTARADFRATATLTGILLDESGVAGAGATVQARAARGGRLASQRATTDASG